MSRFRAPDINSDSHLSQDVLMRCTSLALVFAVVVGCGKAAPTGTDPVKGDGPSPVAEKGKRPPILISTLDSDKSASAAFPPATWTHRELAEYLGQKGVKVEVRPVGIPFTSYGIPVAALDSGPDSSHPSLLAYVCRDAQHARDQAGTMGEGAFASGRFAIGLFGFNRPNIDDAALLRRVKAALTPSGG